ncbi:MAG TPA: septum formation initiator family protein [Lachnospiraceae bacterium]|nr:septum formation initiator family protein [Lachnospiraceae bacterium]
MFALKSISLRQSKDTLNQQIADMEEKVAEEEERATQLQEFETYTHTKKYAEEVAKEVLGYVYDGEIIFQLDE